MINSIRTFLNRRVIFLLIFSLGISACSNTAITDEGLIVNNDSCSSAIQAENAKVAEAMVSPDFSGELNNYWGDDTSKLDFQYIYKNGKLVKSYFYYENQQIQEEYSFLCGSFHGSQKWYHENGKLAKMIPYSYGYRQGTGSLYDENGHLVQKVSFRNDSVIGEIQNFDRSGKLMLNDTIQK
jgi:antitoxin component YwqK of YwqJK toxin-antitoxin module